MYVGSRRQLGQWQIKIVDLENLDWVSLVIAAATVTAIIVLVLVVLILIVIIITGQIIYIK